MQMRGLQMVRDNDLEMFRYGLDWYYQIRWKQLLIYCITDYLSVCVFDFRM